MCRIAAYLGPSLTLSKLLRDSSHSLTDQSRNAKEMNGSSTAGDGWGVGWYTADQETPGMLKSILPLWSDLNAETAPHAIAAHCIVGHVRLASPGVEVCFTNTPLFVLDQYLFTMNGELTPWPGPLSRRMRAALNGADEARVHGSTDAEMVAALWRTCLRRQDGDMGHALQEALRQATELALGQGGSVKANVILTDGSTLVATRYAVEEEPTSLYYLFGEDRWQGGAVVASEPLDDGPGWREVPRGTLLQATRRGVQQKPLSLAA